MLTGDKISPALYLKKLTSSNLHSILKCTDYNFLFTHMEATQGHKGNKMCCFFVCLLV